MEKKLVDRLYDRVNDVGHVCVGLDTDVSYIPKNFKNELPDDRRVFEFNKAIIDATSDVAAVYKVQIAYYEALGVKGLMAYADTLGYLRDKNAIVIADVKRGDIAKTAEMYAQAHFSGDFEADFITINPFMGKDTLTPFMHYVENYDKGFFALVATSNPGASDIQGLKLKDDSTVSQQTGELLNSLAKKHIGESGFSPVGAVVGCTNTEQTVAIREQLSSLFFLIPGYGAQGGTAEDMKDYLKNGNGGVVNSSRGILLAGNKEEYKDISFDQASRQECLKMREAIRNAL